MHVLATAGHVDHGKSTLVEALTGSDPDRLAEEHDRGLTIDLGFAWTTIRPGEEVAFVDVPGHVRFIKNMLAGVGAVDACLFVVAATEGWKPQSEEHLRILELLGVARGVVALTKVASLEGEELALARLEVDDRLSGTFLEAAELVEVDVPAGHGIEELRGALGRLLSSTPEARDRGRPRLWVDRSFSAKGSGTVVTGTLAGGVLAVDDEVSVVGPGPLGSPTGHGRRRPFRVRGLQTHRRGIERAGPGRRLAVNLSGLPHEQIVRGDAVVHPGQWFPASTLDATLRVLATLGHDVSRRGAFQVYLGSGEHPVALRILGAQTVSPGSRGLVRLHLPVALPLLPGDRYVLRESGRSETVGGGEILDVAPVLPASRARPSRSVERVVAERGWIDAGLLERLTGAAVAPTVAGRWVVDPEAFERARSEVGDMVGRAGPLGLDPAALDERQRAVAATLDGIVSDGGRLRPADGLDARRVLAEHPWLRQVEEERFGPPHPRSAGVSSGELREMVRHGLVTECDGFWFSPRAVADAAATVASLLDRAPQGVTVAEVRVALATSRKYLLPLLAHLDATGVTRRRGDLRVAGPRLPPVR